MFKREWQQGSPAQLASLSPLSGGGKRQQGEQAAGTPSPQPSHRARPSLALASPLPPCPVLPAAAAAALLLASGASAQGAPPPPPGAAPQRKHALQRDLPAPHGDVETSAALVSAAGEWLNAGGVPAGTAVSLVCGLVNKGDRRINVTLVTAMLSDRYNNERLVRDLGREYIEKGAVVDPGAPDGDVGPAEISLAFSFKLPDEAWLRDNKASGFGGFPYKVRLSAAVVYDEHVSASFASVFFNETITLVAPGGPLVDAHAMVPWFAGSLIAACVLFMFIDSVPGFAEGHDQSLASLLYALVAGVAALLFGVKPAAPAAAAAASAGGADGDEVEKEARNSVLPLPSASRKSPKA